MAHPENGALGWLRMVNSGGRHKTSKGGTTSEGGSMTVEGATASSEGAQP